MAVKVEVSRPLSILEVDMMNNKWIVPIVAMILCAVSLIGAGYAAYTATLTSSETVTVDQNYVKLTTGTAYKVADEINVYWDYSIAYSGGTPSNPVYKPYLDVNTTDGEMKYCTVFKLSVTKDATHLDSNEVTDSNSYTLAIDSHSCDFLTGTVIEVFKNENLTETATLSALSYDTVYYVALGYEHKNTDNITDGNYPSDTAKVTVSVTATANLVTKS